MSSNYKRRSLETNIPTPLKLFTFDSNSTSSCSSAHSPADLIIPQRETNPIMNDLTFSMLLCSPFESCGSTSCASIGTSSTPNSKTSSRNSLRGVFPVNSKKGASSLSLSFSTSPDYFEDPIDNSHETNHSSLKECSSLHHQSLDDFQWSPRSDTHQDDFNEDYI